MKWTQSRCDMATADGAERLAKRLRDGLPIGSAIAHLEHIRNNAHGRAPMAYALLLGSFNVGQLDVDVAVASIGAGKHPPDSLPGRLAEEWYLLRSAMGERARGSDDAIVNVFEWIGAKP